MKKTYICFLCCAFVGIIFFNSCASHYKNDSVGEIPNASTINGYAQISNKTFDSLSINGTAELTNITIYKKLQVRGRLDGTTIVVEGGLDINGSAELHDVKIKGITVSSGFLEATKSIFNDIFIATKIMQLCDCLVQSIIVKPNSTGCGQDTVQIVELTNTIVNGSITFENGNGRVIAKKDSKVIGKIVGGVLEP